MDIVRASRTELSNLPEYIITNFIPGARPLLLRYPKIFRFLGVLLALWYLSPLARLQAIWSRFAQFLISTVTVSSEEDLFQYVASWISDQRTLRANNTLNAVSNTPVEERRRRRRDYDYEEAARKPREDPKIKYEQIQGLQIFVHQKRIYFVTRAWGEGYTYTNNRHKRIEILNVSCFGRSTQPVKNLLEEVYELNKNKEKTMTIIRRPFTGGSSSRLSWSRLTAKPRRALDTVILDADRKAAILKDIEEYMDESTQAFYGDHGIPYRRGYLFYGPPGCGKTSFCLALASKFDLDVYVLTLLDHDLQDSDLMSLMNQLPSPSLLLLEDIDTAGLSRKRPFAMTSSGISVSGRRGRRRDAAEMAMANTTEKPVEELDLESGDDDGNKRATKVSLSGLLNAIDGVAAPEGHILVMTTNKPQELDDALVRAGRISVKVAFTNASKQQAEEMFLRIYLEIPDKSITFEESVDSKSEHDLKDLAKRFSEQIPEEEFSPADLQDYLILHKKDPAGAVNNVQEWIDDRYEERKRKEAEKEAEIRYKAQKAERRRRQFREDMRAALDTKGGKQEAEEEKVDNRPVEEQIKEAEAEIAAEDRARP